MAAMILDERGLLRTKDWECGIWHRHQLPRSDPRKGRTSTVGAIGSACVHLDHIADETHYLEYLRHFAGVRVAPLVETGRKLPELVALLQACAAALEAER